MARQRSKTKRVLDCMHALGVALAELPMEQQTHAMLALVFRFVEVTAPCKECQHTLIELMGRGWHERIEQQAMTPDRCVCDRATLH